MSEKIAVHCKTEEAWGAVQERFPWPDGHSVSWGDRNKNKPCLRIEHGHCLGHGDVDHYGTKGYTIIPASEYLREEEFKDREYKGLKIPRNLHGRPISTEKSGCASGPGSLSEIKCQHIKSCSGCIAYEQNRDILEEYLSTKQTNKPIKEESKTEIDEVDPEEVCKFCRDNEICSARLCEGSWCEEALEAYLEENNLTVKEDKMSVDINSSIKAVFNKDPFELVEKMQNNFGGQISQDFTGRLMLQNNKAAYVTEIKRIDDEKAAAEKAAKK